jgi:GAF domain-containing protein
LKTVRKSLREDFKPNFCTGHTQIYQQVSPMASAHEMHAVSSDPVRARNLALSLLALAKTAENIFSEWELTFLRDIAEQSAEVIELSRKERKEYKFSSQEAQAQLALRDFRLTYRQTEKLIEIRDTATFHREISGVSVGKLVARCHEARLDLDEGDEEFVARLWKSGATELRTPDLMRLKRCSIQLGELEPYM